MKTLLLGNEAVARGLYEAGCTVVSSYPGTPSTEITEAVANYKEIYAEWAPNEKVAMEVAIGASIGGARSFCAMKHVGLNVAADPLFTSTYTGVNGGMVIGVADDPGMHSSQNEQDSRHYAMAAKLPMVEPADSQECKEFVAAAYEISETYDTPVLLRLSTRISHSQSLVELCDRKEVPLKEYKKNPAKYVMAPANAKKRHVVVEERILALKELAEKTGLNRIEDADSKIGVITSGISYQYVKEAVGEKAAVLKLGLVNPLPVELIRQFAQKYETIYVAEELDPIIETHVKALGIDCHGKDVFPLIGELSQRLVKKVLFGEESPYDVFGEDVPIRPPVMCPGCPHRGVFYVLSKLGVMVSGDIGCYTLGASAPLFAVDSTVCMGASISGLHGFNKARGLDSAKNSVAVIGDSTFMHSGITGLIDITYNEGVSTVIVMDNSITGMTGHQQNPTTGKTLKGDIVEKVSIEKICEAAGVKRIRVVDPFDMKETERVIKEELAAEEPSVIITRRPCALLKYVKHEKPFTVDRDKCRSCKMCLKIGCPAISMQDGKAAVDETLCVGCGLCKSLCPFDAIQSGEEK
ncbi:indolepyruvate ferredoxin oxidoreductase subunit alpha [Zongyangia hominis]|uniref:Indolepyruvate oxidoreductase subunit IorA n=1 Tax=Zongyangia hominis TaxID=2763677 RepID=A0A926EFI5_9FIRM|nr:indolepyruvate ferredoxin oxidoreductase subunit alpha [Zongyangia hominis]MBC8571131.1 indolepyruvate ferredoxin oxidoreductase subunit alpha [Zongyangia hominis]